MADESIKPLSLVRSEGAFTGVSEEMQESVAVFDENVIASDDHFLAFPND